MTEQPTNPSTSPSENKDQTSWRESPLLLIKGFLMGSADIVPGVSGGTMALILGIYNRLIHAISSFDLPFLKRFFSFRWKEAFRSAHWKFFIALLAGIFCAVLFFTQIVPLQVYMFTDPEIVYGLFFGLIIGSIYILIKAIDNFTWQQGAAIIAGILIGLWVVTRLPAETPESALFIFLSGATAICAMILPGISGSYILLILRKYDFILSQLAKLGGTETLNALWILLPFILGAIVGLALFARLLTWLLDHFYATTLAVLIGFLIGSLYVIWPYQHRTYKKFVSKTEVVTHHSRRAQHLRTETPNTNLPEYERLGEVMSSEASGGPKRVEIETVKQKLIHSQPYVPGLAKRTRNAHFWDGIWGIIIGLIMVIGLDFLHKEDKQPETL